MGNGRKRSLKFPIQYLSDLSASISTFAHLNHAHCLTTPSHPFDIGIIDAPFDTAVSYRPGARFGPRALRAASARQTSFRGFNHRADLNPYDSWATILDCGDIPITPFGNELALHQMTLAYEELLSRSSTESEKKPMLITLGGNHSVALPSLRALYKAYKQPIAILHFDAHLDTLHPGKLAIGFYTWENVLDSNEKGLLRNGSNVHGGLRSRLAGNDYSDYLDDSRQSFLKIEADEIDKLGTQGIIDMIMTRIGIEVPVYLSVDIDVIDPGLAPGTGTPEPGGWTTRETIAISRGVESLNVVGADLVEVSPSYDGVGEQTALAGAQIIYEIMTSVVKKGLRERGLDIVSKEESLQENTLRNLKDEL